MKAIALISGGLDSILAARLIKEQGIEVIPLNFKIPFCHLKKSNVQALVTNALAAELKTIDIGRDFLRLIESPRYGFGSNLNPCIDCKILMLSKAKELLAELGASFIVSGEVLGQRPMSQNRQSLELIEKRAGLEGLLLRPLCAKHLPPTEPEKAGWVKREELLDFSGRGRKTQFALAEKFQIKDFSWPAGGCLLTDPEFSKRLEDLKTHQELTLENVELLKIGRHFRLSDTTKLIVGRNEKEDRLLEGLAKEMDYLFFPPEEIAGPTALGRGEFSEELINLSCRIILRYFDTNGSIDDTVLIKHKNTALEGIKAAAFSEEELKVLRI